MLTGSRRVRLPRSARARTNLVNAVANAWLDRVPMLAISGQIESKRSPTHPQVVPGAPSSAPVCKWATTIQRHRGDDPAQGRADRDGGAPGPVHMTLGADVVGAQAVDDRIALPPLAAQKLPFAFAPRPPVAGVVSKIRAARRPVILAGIAAVRAMRPRARRSSRRVAGLVPVVVRPMAKGVLAEDHPSTRARWTCLQRFMWKFLGRLDLVVAAGFDAVDAHQAVGLEVARSTSTRRRTPTRSIPAEVELVGPVAAILEALASACAGPARWSAAEVASHRDALVAKYYEGRVAGRLNPTDVIDVVRRAMPREAIATADVGSHKILVGQGWTT